MGAALSLSKGGWERSLVVRSPNPTYQFLFTPFNLRGFLCDLADPGDSQKNDIQITQAKQSHPTEMKGLTDNGIPVSQRAQPGDDRPKREGTVGAKHLHD